jgi:hypothetical protein
LESKNSHCSGWSKGRQGFGAVGLGPSFLDPLSKFAPRVKCSEFASRNVLGRGIEFVGLALDLPLRELELGELLLNSWYSKLGSDIGVQSRKLMSRNLGNRDKDGGDPGIQGDIRKTR